MHHQAPFRIIRHINMLLLNKYLFLKRKRKEEKGGAFYTYLPYFGIAKKTKHKKKNFIIQVCDDEQDGLF